MIKSLLLCLIFHITLKAVNTETFSHHSYLNNDHSVLLKWKVKNETIIFQLQTKSLGWIAVGLSPNGGMKNADMVIGWVDGSKTFLVDAHGVGNIRPVKDKIQDTNLLGGKEEDGWTIIDFSRKLQTCNEHDITITEDTMKVIWAYGEADPFENKYEYLAYHSRNRGAKSLILVNNGMGGGNRETADTEEISYEFLLDKFHLPAVDTYYNCKLFTLPDFKEKHHAIEIEPIIQPSNDGYVHHMVAYFCDSSLLLNHSVLEHECYHRNMPEYFLYCQENFFTWAIGGGKSTLPSVAGIPLGESDSPKYFILETHFDNPQVRGDIVDSSGFKMHFTKNLRQYDAGMLQIGRLSIWDLAIPPNQESFEVEGDCSSTCIEKGMNVSNVDKIHIFSTLLHSHLLGRKLELKHVRNGKELKYIARDNSYDFNYQEARTMDPPIEVRKGDGLKMVCHYNSKSVKNTTFGGESTKEEMCLAFAMYYPKIKMNKCQSWVVQGKFLDFLKVDVVDYRNIVKEAILLNSTKGIITLSDYWKTKTWTKDEVLNYNKERKEWGKYHYCSEAGFLEKFQYHLISKDVIINESYVEPDLCKKSEQSQQDGGRNKSSRIASGLSLQILLYIFIAYFF